MGCSLLTFILEFNIGENEKYHNGTDHCYVRDMLQGRPEYRTIINKQQQKKIQNDGISQRLQRNSKVADSRLKKMTLAEYYYMKQKNEYYIVWQKMSLS